MIAVGVNVTIRSNPGTIDFDSARAHYDFQGNGVSTVTFAGIWIQSHDSSTNYVVRTSDKRIIVCDLREITVTTLAPTLS